MEEMKGGLWPFFSSDPFRKQAWPRGEVTNENNTTPFEWDYIKPIVLAANMSTVLW